MLLSKDPLSNFFAHEISCTFDTIHTTQAVAMQLFLFSMIIISADLHSFHA